MSTCRLPLLLAGFSALAFSHTSSADAVGVNVGVFNGIAVEYHKAFRPTLNARLALTTMPVDVDMDEDDIKYKAEIDKDNFGVLLDWHPFSGSFRVTGGLYLGDHDWLMSAKANNGEYDIGDNTYQSNDLKLEGDIRFNQSTPYLGIGWGNTLGEKGLSMSVDLGVLMTGSPTVDYEASGTIYSGGIYVDVGNDPTFQADLEKERQQLEEDLEDLEWMPVLSLGVIYAF